VRAAVMIAAAVLLVVAGVSVTVFWPEVIR
jgi:hypothetical protein